MNPDHDAVEKSLRRHMSLFAAPSASQLDVSRERIRQRLATLDWSMIGRDIRRAPRHQFRRRFIPALAAGVVLAAIGTAILWPRGPQIFTAGNAGTQITLADGSHVEMRAHSELTVERADDGLGIRLRRGDIIVSAAKQRSRHLYVHTKDMTIAVVGTVFMVNTAADGSRVAVIEGEVRVRQRNAETSLRPGQQVATSPTIAQRPLKDDISWSRNANTHLAILESFTRGVAQTAGTLQPIARPAAVPDRGAQAGGPEFEEASVRQCDPDNLPPLPQGARGGGANSFYMTPGRTYALCMTLATLVRTAYGLGPGDIDRLAASGRGRGLATGSVYGLGRERGIRVRGGPDWVRTEQWTIEAVAGGASDARTMSGPMLRALLENRFKLKVHVETEQVPAYVLTIAPGGLKLKPVQASGISADAFVRADVKTDACEMPPPSKPGEPPTFKTQIFAEVRAGAKPQCGVSVLGNGSTVQIIGGAMPLGVLGRSLGGALGNVQVIDKTGTTGLFNFAFEVVWDENAPPASRLVLPEPGRPSTGVVAASAIFAALEEQFGLRLEPAQAPWEYVVIDEVERPSPN